MYQHLCSMRCFDQLIPTVAFLDHRRYRSSDITISRIQKTDLNLNIFKQDLLARFKQHSGTLSNNVSNSNSRHLKSVPFVVRWRSEPHPAVTRRRLVGLRQWREVQLTSHLKGCSGRTGKTTEFIRILFHVCPAKKNKNLKLGRRTFYTKRLPLGIPYLGLVRWSLPPKTSMKQVPCYQLPHFFQGSFHIFGIHDVLRWRDDKGYFDNNHKTALNLKILVVLNNRHLW